MKGSRISVLLVLFFAFFANAGEQDYQNNLRVVAYWHPIPLFLGAADDLFMLNSTIEIPLNLSNSVVIQPAIWLGSSDGDIFGIEYEKLVRFGSGVGLRRYAVDRGYGFYLQVIASAYYVFAERIDHWKDVNGAVSELMLYAGSSHKWQNLSFFYEAGMGFGYDGTKTQQIGYDNKLVGALNVGVGLPF